MKVSLLSIGILTLSLLVTSLPAQENRNTVSASASQPPPPANYLELQGDALGEVTEHDVMMLNFHVPLLVDRLKQSGRAIPEEVNQLLAAARAANDKHDRYRAFRLYARAAGLAEGKVEQFEVAAAFKLSLDRAIFASGENITLTVRPLFNLGHPLANRYTVHSWLETETGVIAGSDQTLTVSELREYHFDYPVEHLQDGVIAIGYRLTSPTGETMAELRQAVVVAKDIQKRLDQLKAKFAAAKQPGTINQTLALASALATVEYNIQNIEWERTKFDGNWQRAAHPFGMYLGRMNFIAMGREAGNSFPQFNARLRYPQDIAFAESLIDSLSADPDTLLKQSGDMAQAFRSTVDGKFLRYRIYVPRGYDRAKKYSLVVALHSGAGDSTYFEWEDSFSSPGRHIENRFKQLTQERGYIVVCPNGASGTFLGEGDDPDIVALAERVRELYSIEPKRVFLTGWSMGASATWRIAMQHPELIGAAAPVGGDANWLNRQNTEKARNLPILYSVTIGEAQGAQSTTTSAKEFLSNFSYKEYPDTDHITVWSKALPAVFDFFDTVASSSSSSRTDTHAVTAANTTAESIRPLAIGEYRTIISSGEKIEYFVKLPEQYEKSSRRYPVLFVMNGNNPSTVANAYSTLEMLSSEMIPEMILIGVGNPQQTSFFPVNPSNGQPGGADVLVRFVAEELVPQIDARYRTQKYRILFGQSNAGLFAVYAFLSRPEIFDACIAASPTLGWSLDFMKGTARKSLAENRDFHKRLYIAYGGRDYGRLVKDAIPSFTDLLRHEAPTGLLWKSEALELDGHVPVVSLNNGLLFIFSDFLASDELKAAGLKAVDAHFASLSQRYGIQLQAPEETLFDLSHQLYREREYREAIAGFETVLERYPYSVRARLWLGDSYRDSGDIAKAREAYRECLKSDPGDWQAKQRLDQLQRR